MKKRLVFQTVAFDTHYFPAGTLIPAGSKFKYFDSSETDEGDEVTKESEEAIIKWLLRPESARNLLLSVLGVEINPFIARSVKQPIVENPQLKPGDIDLIICGERRADQAIGIQCKTVNVRAFNQDQDDINKLPSLKDAVIQVNKQRENFGFYRNYLAVLVKAYGRGRSQYNVLFRGANQNTMKLLYEFPYRERLHPDVGILFIDITQPTGKGFDRMAVVGICHDQPAARLEQTVNLTNRVKELMDRQL